jgi:hypothetical protein
LERKDEVGRLNPLRLWDIYISEKVQTIPADIAGNLADPLERYVRCWGIGENYDVRTKPFWPPTLDPISRLPISTTAMVPAQYEIECVKAENLKSDDLIIVWV